MPGTPDKIKQLTETFNNNIDYYKSPNFNETQLRREFIDPFFAELNFDNKNDKQIERLVYQLYGLREEEIRIVEVECIG